MLRQALLKITRPTFSVRHFLRLKVAATNSVKEKSSDETGPKRLTGVLNRIYDTICLEDL